MKHLKRETYSGTTWCAGCREMIKPNDTAFRDHARHHVYCEACAKAADHRVALEMFKFRRQEIIASLKKLHGDDATIPLDAIVALLPVHPEWA